MEVVSVLLERRPYGQMEVVGVLLERVVGVLPLIRPEGQMARWK